MYVSDLFSPLQECFTLLFSASGREKEINEDLTVQVQRRHSGQHGGPVFFFFLSKPSDL